MGLTPPSQGSTGSTLVRIYTDSSGAQRTLTMAFDWRAGRGNYIRVAGVPNDLGMAWDRIVDGSMDGTAGDILYTSNYNGGLPNVFAWPSAAIAPTGTAALLLLMQF